LSEDQQARGLPREQGAEHGAVAGRISNWSRATAEWSRGTPGRIRTRRVASAALGVFAAIALLVSILSGYASNVFFNSDQFSNHVTSALDRPAVRDEVARRVTDQVLKAQPDLVGVRPLIESAASQVVDNNTFQSLLRSAVRDVHRAIFKRDQNTVTLTVADIGAVLRGALAQFDPKAAKKLPGAEEAEVLSSDPPPWLLDLARTAQGVREFAVSMFVVFGVTGALGLLLSLDRRRYISRLGIATAVGAAILLLAYQIGRSVLLDKIAEPDVRAAAAGVWDTFLGDLQVILLLAAGIGLILAAAARSLISPVGVEAPIAGVWQRITTVPQRTSMRVLRALLLVLAGLIIIFEREAVISLAVLVGGLYVLYKGVEELLRLIARPREPAASQATAAPGGGSLRRQRLAIAGAAGLAVLLAVGLLAAFGGAKEPAPGLKGCNGSEKLCDKPLADVVLPATHNAMSGAGIDGYLFANQDHAIPQQLDDGVRALLFDTHYGIPANGGKVKTDLGRITGKERREYEKELGPAAVDAALRIRDRLITGGEGEHQIYLCHRFCELGFVPLSEALADIRNFVVQHPDQVLVIDNEDYVSPNDFVAAVEHSGLADYVYGGPITSSEPTLGQMIETNKRVVLMAENDAGVAPWYRDGYADVLQETPYSFKKASELTAPDQLRRSCRPNRGSDDNPLFLLNHWVDTSPAPKPSNAVEVNASKALLARIRECQRVRGQLPDLIAVDFYATGDLMKVVDKLNGVSGQAP
jgi:hypothetical protein